MRAWVSSRAAACPVEIMCISSSRCAAVSSTVYFFTGVSLLVAFWVNLKNTPAFFTNQSWFDRVLEHSSSESSSQERDKNDGEENSFIECRKGVQNTSTHLCSIATVAYVLARYAEAFVSQRFS